MAKVIRLPDQLVKDAVVYGKMNSRTPNQQIEHWVYVGKIAEQNPNLEFRFIQEILSGLKQAKSGNVSKYKL